MRQCSYLQIKDIVCIVPILDTKSCALHEDLVFLLCSPLLIRNIG